VSKKNDKEGKRLLDSSACDEGGRNSCRGRTQKLRTCWEEKTSDTATSEREATTTQMTVVTFRRSFQNGGGVGGEKHSIQKKNTNQKKKKQKNKLAEILHVSICRESRKIASRKESWSDGDVFKGDFA